MSLRKSNFFKVLAILFVSSALISFDSSFNKTNIKRDEILGILNSLLKYDTQLVVLNSLPYCLNEYDFDGQPFNKNYNFGCLNPILYYSSIHSNLQTVDINYDSLYYQSEIDRVGSLGLKDWRHFGLNDYSNVTIRNHKIIGNLKGRFQLSLPILNSKRDIAIVGYIYQLGERQCSSRILILRKNDVVWKVVNEINQIDNYLSYQLFQRENNDESIKELPSTLKNRNLIIK